MKRLRRSSGLFLSCVLLLATMAPAASARPGDAPLANGVNKLTVLGAECYPWSDDADYENNGSFVMAVSGLVSFICPVLFPEQGTHRVQSITMYAKDTHTTENLCAVAGRSDPNTGGEQAMAQVCSAGSAAGLRSFTVSGTSISPNSIAPNQGMYLWLTTKGASKLKLYGFHMDYDVCHALHTTVSPAGSGSIIATPGANCIGDTYLPGTLVELEASEASGWDFVGWSGDASGSTITTTVTMDSEKSVTAHFMCSGCVPRAFLPLVLRNY